MPKKKRVCFHCSSLTHLSHACPTIFCFKCNQQGHEPHACPSSPSPPPNAPDLGSFSDLNHHTTTYPAKTNTFRYIELFAGIGGFRVALDSLGGQCVFSSEIEKFAQSNYLANHGDKPAGDITKIDAALIAEHDILSAGFPCQPFSFSGKLGGFGDARGTLFLEIVKIAKAKRPKALLLENVRGLLLHDSGRTLATIIHELSSCGYTVTYQVLNADSLLPQERARIFIVGIRNDLIDAGCKGSVQFVFPVLPELNRGVRDIIQPPSTATTTTATTTDTPLTAAEETALSLSSHQLSKVTSQPYTTQHPQGRFIQHPGNKPMRTLQSNYGHYMVGSQFVPVCGLKEESESSESSSFSNNADGSVTIGDGPWRRLSFRECARLQGFPESWKLHPQRSYNLFGNAVPPPLIAMVAAPLLMLCGITPVASGWEVAKRLLLDAAPADRRESLRVKLDGVDADADAHLDVSVVLCDSADSAEVNV